MRGTPTNNTVRNAYTLLLLRTQLSSWHVMTATGDALVFACGEVTRTASW